MARGAPSALPTRGRAWLIAAAVLAAITFAPAQHIEAEGQVRTVSLMPDFPSYDVEIGQFAVHVVVRGDPHQGFLEYDDDRDGVADRTVESLGLGAFEFALRYNPDVVQYAALTENEGLNIGDRAFQCLQRNDEPGTFEFACFSLGSGPGPQPGDSDLTLATITLLPVAAGFSSLVLEGQLSGPLGDDIPAEISGGSVTLSAKPGMDDATAAPQTPTNGGPATPAQQPPADGQDTEEQDEEQGSAGPPDPPSASGRVTPVESDGPDGSRGEAASQSGIDAEMKEAARGAPALAGDLEAENVTAVDGAGSSPWPAVVWSLAAVAGVVAAVAVGFAAFRWQGSR